LAIAKYIQFRPGTKILDVGTGGGFPGIPLAIYFPEVEFHLVDSIAKKITVVTDVAKELHLANVKAECVRSETLVGKYDFVTSRAVAPSAELTGWNYKNISKLNKNKLLNGFIFLKGGDLTEELKLTRYTPKIQSLAEYFAEPYFEEKKLIYLSDL
jgi:16S rRNA (guanine527-N7)-methyltransferase